MGTREPFWGLDWDEELCRNSKDRKVVSEGSPGEPAGDDDTNPAH
jgi:hypothetical protein